MPRSLRSVSHASILAALFTLTASTLALAYPMNGEPWNLKQPDGTMVSVLVWGDEYYQVVESIDGYTLIRDPHTDVICYARLSPDEMEFESTGVRVGSAVPGALGLSQHLRIRPESSYIKAKQMRDMAGVEMPGVFRPAAAPPPSTGNVLGLVLIVDFDDQTATIPRNDVDNFCNQQGYNQNGNNGSIQDYFDEVSDGALNYTSWVMPAYHRASEDFSYYDDCTVNWLDRARELIVETLTQLEADGHDFSVYDSNSDGYIDALNLFYAGNTGCGWSMGMWPGSSGMQDMWSADGVATDRFQITGMGSSLSIGTYCHENGHMVGGWPDLYDYSPPGPTDSAGAGQWCLMANQFGLNPQEPCAFLKMTAGWLTPTTLNSDQFNVAIGPSSNNGNVFKLPSPNANEFYMLENRRQTGRDANLPDSGLEILHIETTNGSNTNQEMTTALHYLVTIVQADGNWDLENNVNPGDSGDLYSSPSNTAFTPCTDPVADWWDFNSSGYYITNISASQANMTFDITVGDELPTAACKDFSADADTDCCIDVSVDDIDNGSNDANGPGDIESILITAVDGNPVTPTETVEVCGDGLHTVTLTITDLCGNTDACDANVEVVNSPPVALCQYFSANADTLCCIIVHKDDIDNGSYDPDGAGDIKSFGITAVDGNAISLVDSVQVCGNGPHTVTLTITDWCDSTSSCDADVDVVDVTPPDLSVELDPNALWPPNHKLVDITATVEVTDNCDPDPYWELYNITSDEPDNGKADGDTDGDIAEADLYTEDVEFQLRSERMGKEDGRKYTVVYRAEDESGNVAFDTACVTVPHDQSAAAMASFGYTPTGTGFTLGAREFTVVLLSHKAVYEQQGNREVLVKPALDATAIDLRHAYVGNTAGVARQLDSRAIDVNHDGLLDLALKYSVDPVMAIKIASESITPDQIALGAIFDGPVGLHVAGKDETPFLVSNIFALGEPVVFRPEEEDEPTVDPKRPYAETVPELEGQVTYRNAIASIFPNPFNPATTVRFTLAEAGSVTIGVYDVRGALVRVLVDENRSSGEHTVAWDGVDAEGRSVATGVYFVRMNTAGFETTRKMVMVK